MTNADELDSPPYDPADDVRDSDEMANLYPRETGLPRTIWASPKGYARHDVRVKVSSVSGDRMDFDNAAVISVRPEPRLVHGSLPAAVSSKVIEWVALNRAVLIDYWDGRLGTIEFATRLKPV